MWNTIFLSTLAAEKGVDFFPPYFVDSGFMQS